MEKLKESIIALMDGLDEKALRRIYLVVYEIAKASKR